MINSTDEQREPLPPPVVKSLQPVFIVGTSKSGTSLLLSLFDAHPQCVTLFETAVYMFPQKQYESLPAFVAMVEQFLAPRFEILHVAENVNLSALTACVERMVGKNGLPSPSDIPRFLLRALVRLSIQGTLEEEENVASHFFEKTPQHYGAVERIFEDFPQAKIIHVLRDPRDNYLSLKRRLTKSDSSQFHRTDYHPILFMRHEILKSLNAAHANKAQFGDRYHVVYYEDLIEDPSNFLDHLIDWLGLSWDPTLLRPSIAGSNWGGNSTARELTDNLKPFDKRPVGRWKRELSHREIRLMERVIISFNLQSQFPVERSISWIEFVARLALPFSHEISKEMQIARQGGNALTAPIKLLIRYVRHRMAVLYHLGPGRKTSVPQ
jgi:hypothetical protein